MGWCKEDRSRLFSVVSSDQTRGSRHKLKYRKLHLKIRKPPNIFIVRVLEHLNRFPRNVLESPSLEILKSHLDRVLGNQL